jgi:hypothetical protein
VTNRNKPAQSQTAAKVAELPALKMSEREVRRLRESWTKQTHDHKDEQLKLDRLRWNGGK